MIMRNMRKRLLSIGTAMVLVCTLLTSTFTVSADCMDPWEEGWWQRVMGSSGVPLASISQDGALVIANGGGDEQHLTLNATVQHQSSLENRTLFPYNNMANFTAEYWMQVSSFGPGGKIGFVINNQNQSGGHLGDGAVHVRWRSDGDGQLLVMKEGAGAGTIDYGHGLGSYTPICQSDGHWAEALPVSSGWVKFKIIKAGASLQIFMNDVQKFNIDMTGQVDSAYLGSGYIGFHAQNVACSVRNMTVTNNTTGASKSFFTTYMDDELTFGGEYSLKTVGEQKVIDGIMPNSTTGTLVNGITVTGANFAWELMRCDGLVDGRLVTGSVAIFRSSQTKTTYSYPIVVKGDLYGNGYPQEAALDFYDAYLLKQDVSSFALNGIQMLAADYNGLDGIDITDALSVKEWLLNIDDWVSPIPNDLGAGVTYYVSNDGNDGNSGTSEAAPLKTAAKISLLNLKVGDNILFKRGEVFDGAYLSNSSDTNFVSLANGDWVTIDAYGYGARPVFRGAATAAASQNAAAISLSSHQANGYRIRNIDFENYKTGIAGFRDAPAAGNIQVNGLVIENCSFKNITYGKLFETQLGGDLPKDWIASAIVLNYARNVTIKNVSTDNADCPVRIRGENTLVDGFTALNSGIQGMMIYGMYEGSAVQNNQSNITLQNLNIKGTGSLGFRSGTTGILMESLNGCTVKDSEISYTVNGSFAFDACAVDWEGNNYSCVIDNVYAHDNDGPFLLAMESGSTGNSRGGVIRNSLSVNNGRRDNTEEGSFINHATYMNANQAITVENCIDIGRDGTVPYSYTNGSVTKYLKATLGHSATAGKIDATGFVSGTTDVYEDFDVAGLGRFQNTSGTSISNAHLSLANGSNIRTTFSGQAGMVASTYLKGDTDFVFFSDAQGDNGYIWSFSQNKLTASKLVNGVLSEIKDTAVSGLNPNEWFRVRVETAAGGDIKTYINEVLVDVLNDITFTSGSVGYKANSAAQADQLMVYSYANKTRQVESFAVSGTKVAFTSSSGTNWYNTSSNWTIGSGVTFLWTPQSVGFFTITAGTGRNIYRTTTINTTTNKKVHILMANGTTSETMTLTWRRGSTDYTKVFTIAAKSNDSAFPFSMVNPHWRLYTLDMSGEANWTAGSASRIGLRFADNTAGSVAIRTIAVAP